MKKYIAPELQLTAIGKFNLLLSENGDDFYGEEVLF